MRALSAALLGLLWILLPAPAPAAGIAAAKTKVVEFKPAMMAKHTTEAGYCWTDSIASQRSDAFRCMVGNEIHDPCFEIDAKSVACPEPSNVASGVRIALTKPLPERAGNGAKTAWMMRIAGGSVCSMETGTTVEGHPFSCSGNLVCTAPVLKASGQTVFVSCGVAESAIRVVRSGRYLVTQIYE